MTLFIPTIRNFTNEKINIKNRINKMKQIKVFISSCNCNKTFATLVEKVVNEQKIDAQVSIVDDMMEIMQYNVMSLPALVVDGEVVARGKKSESELIEILK